MTTLDDLHVSDDSRSSAFNVGSLTSSRTYSEFVGEEDAITPPALSEELHAAIRGSHLVRIADASHLANLDRPNEFNRAIDDFLSAADARV